MGEEEFCKDLDVFLKLWQPFRMTYALLLLPPVYQSQQDEMEL